MERELVSHRVGLLGQSIRVLAIGDPGATANRSYAIEYSSQVGGLVGMGLDFQSGDPAEGINGISNEALLAIVEDRLAGFKKGPFSCRENAIALTKIQEAMMWLQRRTREREMRGVEGTQEV